MAQSTRSKLAREELKASLPGDFPLSLHPNGQFCKKYHGRVFYFGRQTEGWQKALKRFHEEWDGITGAGVVTGVGRAPAADATLEEYDDFTIRDAVNHFLTAKTRLVENGELSPRSMIDYKATCAKVVKSFGPGFLVKNLRPDDFDKLRQSLAEVRGPTGLANEIVRTRMIFKFCFDQQYIAKQVHYGQTFAVPKAKVRRKNRNEAREKHGKRMLEADEIRQILDVASPALKSMVILAANCAFGQSDLSGLRLSHLDLDGRWCDYPRPKTEVERRCKLWSETVAAIKEWLPQNPRPKNPDDIGLVFVTKYGSRWTKLSANGSPDDGIGKAFSKLLKSLG